MVSTVELRFNLEQSQYISVWKKEGSIFIEIGNMEQSSLEVISLTKKEFKQLVSFLSEEEDEK